MNKLIENIEKLHFELEQKYGEFDLFCVIELEEFENQWDVLASAKWLPSSESAAISLLIDYIHDNLSEDDLLCISRVGVLSYDEPFVQELLRLKGGQFDNIVISGLSIKSIFIISKRELNISESQENLKAMGLELELTEEDLYEFGLFEKYSQNFMYTKKYQTNRKNINNIEDMKSNVIPFNRSENFNVRRRQAG